MEPTEAISEGEQYSCMSAAKLGGLVASDPSAAAVAWYPYYGPGVRRQDGRGCKDDVEGSGDRTQGRT